MADSIIELSLCLSDIDKAFVQPGKNHPEKKYLYNVVVSEMQQPDQYGMTHTVYVNYKAVDGNWYKKYIGKGKVKTFGQQQLPPPAPRTAPQVPVAQAPAPAAPAPRPQAPAPPAPVAPPPTQIPPASADDGQDDLPF